MTLKKKLSLGFGWFLIVGTLFVLVGFSAKEKKRIKLTSQEIKIKLHRDQEHDFLQIEELEQIALNGAGNTHDCVSLYDCARLEKTLKSHPFVAKAQVYSTIAGKLIVEVWERRPIARIMGKSDTYYLDESGDLMPIYSGYTAHLVVFTGEINETYQSASKLNYADGELPDSLASKTKLDDVFALANYIQKHPFWEAQIEQVSVDKECNVTLIPRVGNHRIVLGKVLALDDKFENLQIFYQEGLSKTGWNEYEEVNLEFKNQVVCTKRL